MRRSIELAILNIQERTGYRFIGKEIHYGKTYYVFQDQCDYIDYKYYSADYIRELGNYGKYLLGE